MFKQDKPWVGFLLGLMVPVFGFFFFFLLNELFQKYTGKTVTFKFIIILGVCSNLLPFKIAQRQRLDLQMQGIVGSTIIMVAIVFIYILYFI
jgi:hypothetical protein